MAGVLTIKQIKPQRLKEDALRLELLNSMRKIATGIHEDFQKTTATWDHDVEFERSISLGMAQSPTVHVITTDKIYGYVNDGTEPHPIFAGAYTGLSSKRALSFRWGGKGSYRAKTKPRVIGSTPGGPTGPRVSRPYVQHPGTKPRKFDEVIHKKWTPRCKREMEDAMKRAAKKSEHGIP